MECAMLVGSVSVCCCEDGSGGNLRRFSEIELELFCLML